MTTIPRVTLLSGERSHNNILHSLTFSREHFSPQEAAVVIDVAGLGFEQFDGKFPETDYQNIVIDAHHYQCFENLAGAQE